MKKNILSFFAGVSLVILTAAATGITEVKPARPKLMFIHKYVDYEEAKNSVIKKSTEGFILKEFDFEWYGQSENREYLIIMEKY